MAQGGNVTYKQLVETSIKTRKLFERFEKKSIGKTWGTEELLIGLMTDIGDLSRLVLAKEGFRTVSGDIALRHELADCFWSIIVLAERYNIDLSEALQEMSDDISIKLKEYNDV